MNKNHFRQWGTTSLFCIPLNTNINEEKHPIINILTGWSQSNTNNFLHTVDSLHVNYMKKHTNSHVCMLKINPSLYRSHMVFYNYHGKEYIGIILYSYKKNAYEVVFQRLRIDASWFQGTWFIVEVEPTKDHWNIWIEDCWYHQGKDIRNESFHERWKTAMKMWKNDYMADPVFETITIRYKPWVIHPQKIIKWFHTQKNTQNNAIHVWIYPNTMVKNTSKIYAWKHIMNDEYNNLALSSTSTSFDTIQIVQTKSWKDLEKSGGIVLHLYKTQRCDIYNCYTADDEDSAYYVGLACVPSKEHSIEIRNWFAQIESSIQDIWVKCKFHTRFKRWVPVEYIETQEDCTYKMPSGTPPPFFHYQ